MNGIWKYRRLIAAAVLILIGTFLHITRGDSLLAKYAGSALVIVGAFIATSPRLWPFSRGPALGGAGVNTGATRPARRIGRASTRQRAVVSGILLAISVALGIAAYMYSNGGTTSYFLGIMFAISSIAFLIYLVLAFISFK